MTDTLSPDLRHTMHAYWRAANDLMPEVRDWRRSL
jgi:hypothetical protein